MGNPNERVHLEDLDVDERIKTKYIFMKLGRGVDWIDLAQDRGRWRAFLNMVMNFRVPKNWEKFFTS